MPLVKIDYVVSFSSEHPEHPASNLLSPDVKSKWLCNKGEPSCSVVLQLKNACKRGYNPTQPWAATEQFLNQFLERNNTMNHNDDPLATKIDSITIGAYHVALIEVLVGSSEKPNDPFEVLLPSCVLQAPGAARRGDAPESVRSFGAAQLAGAVGARRWDRVRLVCSQPYNKHCQYGLAFVHISGPDGPPAAAPAPRALLLDADAASSDDEFRPGELFARHQRAALARPGTDAQIRQASSQALQNISEASTKLTRTPIARKAPDTRRAPSPPHGRRDAAPSPHGRRDAAPPPRPAEAAAAAHKRKRSEDRPAAPEGELLAGAHVALSGYANPRRAALRAAALRLGARYLRDWSPACTHLVCAFPNTPKLRSARAAGARAVAVSGEWLEQCLRRRRLLPWRWFAAEPEQRRPLPPDWDAASDASEPDTDDEIEKVLNQQAKRQRPGAASAADAAVRDERGSGDVTDDDATDEDERPDEPDSVRIEKELPQLWAGRTFALAAALPGARAALLARYVRAYGGLALREAELAPDSRVHFALGAARTGARRVRPAWLWRRHGEAQEAREDN